MSDVDIQPIGSRVSKWGEGPIYWEDRLIYVDCVWWGIKGHRGRNTNNKASEGHGCRFRRLFPRSLIVSAFVSCRRYGQSLQLTLAELSGEYFVMLSTSQRAVNLGLMTGCLWSTAKPLSPSLDTIRTTRSRSARASRR